MVDDQAYWEAYQEVACSFQVLEDHLAWEDHLEVHPVAEVGHPVLEAHSVAVSFPS